MQLKNRTAHTLAQLVTLERDGSEHLVVLLKAEWEFDKAGKLTVVPPLEAPRPADVFRGDPAASSSLGEAELGPVKPSTDVLLRGSAVARRKDTSVMDVLLRVGPVRKVVRVFGERRWKRSLLRKGTTEPLPFERVPLIWEHAFGGTDVTPEDPKHHGAESRNPVGRGFRARGTKLPWEDELCPALEDPDDPTGGPGRDGEPAGFGPIGRGWMPRREYAGTYDERWVSERLPLLPDDFDDRFHNAAPLDQICPRYLRGGEPVELVGCVPEGKVSFALPRLTPAFETRLRTRTESAPMVLETVSLDTDARRLTLLYKGKVRVHGEVPTMRWTECVLREAEDG